MNYTIEYLLEHYSDDANKNVSLLPTKIRPLMCILAAHYPILNGGFRFLFENDFRGELTINEIIASYAQIGLDDISYSIAKLLTLFPDNTLPNSLEERDYYLTKYFDEEIYDQEIGWEKENEEFSPLVGEADALYFKEQLAIEKAIEHYCRKNT